MLAPLGAVDVLGTLKINGKSVSDTYVTVGAFTEAMGKKVDVVEGKQLSTEDFTTEYRKKLAAITTGELTEGGEGYVTSGTVAAALKMKLSADGNLSDVMDKAAARKNIDVYSKAEAGEVFLEISEGLKELVRDGGRDQRADGRGSRRTESKAAGGRRGYPRCRKERYRGAETGQDLEPVRPSGQGQGTQEPRSLFHGRDRPDDGRQARD